MKQCVNQLFVFLSSAVLRGPGVRVRTQLFFMQVTLILFLTVAFLLLKALALPAGTGGVLLTPLLAYPWLAPRVIDPYVKCQWSLFSPFAKSQTRHLGARRTAAFAVLLLLVMALAFSGYWWA